MNQASSASYRVDGGSWLSSESNGIEMDQGKLELTLLQAAPEEITITIQPDSSAIVKPIEQLISVYNQFQSRLQTVPAYLNRSLVQGLERAAMPYSLENLHITERADGMLHIQVDDLKQQLTNNNRELKDSISRIQQLASGLANSFGKLEELPAQSLFQLDSSSLQPYSHYQSQLHSYLPVPMNGLLLDHRM